MDSYFFNYNEWICNHLSLMVSSMARMSLIEWLLTTTAMLVSLGFFARYPLRTRSHSATTAAAGAKERPLICLPFPLTVFYRQNVVLLLEGLLEKRRLRSDFLFCFRYCSVLGFVVWFCRLSPALPK